MSDAAWWTTFYDEDYLRLWGESFDDPRNRAEADALWQVLDLAPGRRLLDAPCGYGRLSRLMAERGAAVVGIDQSAVLLAAAERGRGELPADRLHYVRHDLREPIAEGGFDAAMNVYSSIGHGSEDDDRAVFSTLAAALRPGGRLVVEAMHRDPVVARWARGASVVGRRQADGTLFVETPTWDPVRGRVETSWHWRGPAGAGTKSASLRVYAIPELIAMLAGVGLGLVGAYRGRTAEPYDGAGPDGGGRVAIVVEKP